MAVESSADKLTRLAWDGSQEWDFITGKTDNAIPCMNKSLTVRGLFKTGIWQESLQLGKGVLLDGVVEVRVINRSDALDDALGKRGIGKRTSQDNGTVALALDNRVVMVQGVSERVSAG